MNDAERSEILREVLREPTLAHELFFKARHPDPTPDFHYDMIDDWHGPAARVLTLAFRGSAKSTRAEEAIALDACAKACRNCVIIGESEARAAERLRSIKHEVEFNEQLQAVFQIEPGEIWQETKIILNNGVIIQAYGRGQSLRGSKHLDIRPDLIFCDDLEDEESVLTEAGRAKTLVWFTSTLLPALAPHGRLRMAATPLHPEALAPTLAKQSSWNTKTYPIEYAGPDGLRRAAWPERFPLAKIDQIRADYVGLGMLNSFAQEYLCEAVDQSTRVFLSEHVKITPHVRKLWHPVYAMYDPARTTLKNSATTGKAVWSWVGSKLIIWDASARKWSPSEIIDDMFRLDDEFSPVAIGVEETGLNEWLLQPIRQQAVLRGHTLPLRAINAPKGKFDFIRALQPYFAAGEIEFSRDLPDLRSQLLGFPNGAIDAPNALAYALKMRPGTVVYDNFSGEHIVPKLNPRRAPFYLAINARRGMVAAALVQVSQGRLMVFADWLQEGEIGDAVPDVLKEAALIASRGFDCVAPPIHFQAWDLIGLKGAIQRYPAKVKAGGDRVKGRQEVRSLLARAAHGALSIQVQEDANWTLRAFTGGYCRSLNKEGRISDEPDDNAYAVLMEAIESFAALFQVSEEVDTSVKYSYTSDGRKFVSALPR